VENAEVGKARGGGFHLLWRGTGPKPNFFVGLGGQHRAEGRGALPTGEQGQTADLCQLGRKGVNPRVV